jgi:hypothetical protein
VKTMRAKYLEQWTFLESFHRMTVASLECQQVLPPAHYCLYTT